ncbi:conjugative transposon protein TraM [Chryseobacterium sp. JUb7]|uniref:conjugative transposon protein TraM n=1 Tax=Chryseobacterium sp. JUb7 TaxID=2940599 RepID=UPI00216850B0|nr:conjugative transposon protein TraM [Chryseobacterium sp. JUb7]MCS3529596.1 hypothetical protein [Chryseobacterium sp. JUb7]
MKKTILTICLMAGSLSFAISPVKTIPTHFLISKVETLEKQVKARLITSGQVQNGGTLTFILLEPLIISGMEIKKDQIISGIVNEKDGRLFVEINTIKVNEKIHPVKMKIYSENGIEGLGIIGKKRTSKKAIEIPNGLYVRVMAQETNFEQRSDE